MEKSLIAAFAILVSMMARADVPGPGDSADHIPVGATFTVTRDIDLSLKVESFLLTPEIFIPLPERVD